MTMRLIALPGSPRKDKAAAGFEEGAGISELLGRAGASAAEAGDLLLACWKWSLAMGGSGPVEGSGKDSGTAATAVVAVAMGIATGAEKAAGLGEAAGAGTVLAAKAGSATAEAAISRLAGLAEAAAPRRNLGG